MLNLSIYPKISRNEIKWKEWKKCPGLYLPDKSSFKDVMKDFDEKFDPDKVRDVKGYERLRKNRIEQRLDFLKDMQVPYKFMAPLNKILGNVEL